MGIANQQGAKKGIFSKVPKTQIGRVMKAWRLTVPVILFGSAYIFLIAFIFKVLGFFWDWLDILAPGG